MFDFLLASLKKQKTHPLFFLENLGRHGRLGKRLGKTTHGNHTDAQDSFAECYSVTVAINPSGDNRAFVAIAVALPLKKVDMLRLRIPTSVRGWASLWLCESFTK